jgi:hypothetical protein
MTLSKSRITKVLTRKILTGRILTWAMIPLIVFGSLPRIGCICADGTHKAFCQRHLQGNRAGECVCCERRNVKADVCGAADQPAHAARHACCQSAKEKCGSRCPGLSHGRPCRPVLDQTDVLASAKPVLDLDRSDELPLFVAVELLPVTLASVAADYLRGESLPPPDLVTTLGVLLI